MKCGSHARNSLIYGKMNKFRSFSELSKHKTITLTEITFLRQSKQNKLSTLRLCLQQNVILVTAFL